MHTLQVLLWCLLISYILDPRSTTEFTSLLILGSRDNPECLPVLIWSTIRFPESQFFQVDIQLQNGKSQWTDVCIPSKAEPSWARGADYLDQTSMLTWSNCTRVWLGDISHWVAAKGVHTWYCHGRLVKSRGPFELPSINWTLPMPASSLSRNAP